MKKMLFVVGAILLSGCASSYKPNSIFGGFDETMLSPDTFRISVSGNAFTSGGRVYDFALLRAAELSIQQPTINLTQYITLSLSSSIILIFRQI